MLGGTPWARTSHDDQAAHWVSGPRHLFGTAQTPWYRLNQAWTPERFVMEHPQRGPSQGHRQWAGEIRQTKAQAQGPIV